MKLIKNFCTFDFLKLNMNNRGKYIVKSLLAMLLFLTSGFASAQCTFQIRGKFCVGSPITFLGNVTGTTQNWDFNGEGTNLIDANTNFSFATPGSKTITYKTTINGVPCTSTQTITIYRKPVSKMTLTKADTQCFMGNLFCYKDESSNTNGASIDTIVYLISDGQRFTYRKPTMPNDFCFSVINPLGGAFTVEQFVIDANGCESKIELVDDIYVRARIGASFTSNGKPVKCDSVQSILTNTTQLPQSQIKSVQWIWGDGTSEFGWGPIKSKWYYGQGVYGSKMIVTTNDGCVDSFVAAAIATVFTGKVTILANRDSVCISDPLVQFSVSSIPAGATGFLWNFGNPPIGNPNFNNRSWSPIFGQWGLGPWQISLTYQHPICGNKIVYDTIQVIGPASAIEIPGNRLAEYQTFQCPAYKLEPVQMKNFSSFYHNDSQFLDDDDAYYENGDLKHRFDGGQASIKYKTAGPNIRNISDCIWRTWEFGDNYAPKCTTNTRFNQNTGINCNYNADELPSHIYPSWDQVMLKDFKGAPMQDAIFVESNRLCKRILIWPSDSSYILEDTFITIPLSNADTSLASGTYGSIKTTHTLREKGVRGPGTRYVVQDVDIEIPAGTTIYVGDKDGNNRTAHSGVKTLRLVKDNTLWLNTSTDTVTWLFTVFTRQDTLPLPMLALRNANGEFPKITGKIFNARTGVRGFDYDVNWKRWVDLYYARIPNCNNIKLVHQDTCHPMLCRSEATKIVTMMQANAGGVGSGIAKESVECLGSKNPQYGITFLLDGLKPGCTFSDVQINYDTFCGGNNWNPLAALSPGNRPPGPPYPGYQLAGNPPNRYSTVYSASSVCSPNKCITVGIIVGNGVSQSGVKPLCADTAYYDDFACFPIIDPSFEILEPKVATGQFMKICKNDPIIARTTPGNLTVIDDLESIRWELATPNASPDFAKAYSSLIDENIYRYKKLKSHKGKALDSTILYNYLTIQRGERNPAQIPCTNRWKEGDGYVFGKLDTIITARITAWDTFADVTKVWTNIKERAEANGFDPFSLTGEQIARMIWNNKGVIGQPASGARGCLDTTGFGKDIIFRIIPKPGAKTILHYRDTSVYPIDTLLDPNTGKLVNAYLFRPKWNGWYSLSLAMVSASGDCDDVQAKTLVAGFGMTLIFEDSIICRDDAAGLIARPDYRMFHPDPQFFGTWDPVDYWRDSARQIETALGRSNREAITRWDWHKGDDDPSNPQTIFGGNPYGSTGVGNPFKQLKSTLYYNNDSGVYTFRNIAGDSTGCLDTIERRIFVTRLDVKYSLDLDLFNCNNVINFRDSTILHDPCSWSRQACNGGVVSCDYTNKFEIDWGDGTRPFYLDRANPSGLGISDYNISHKYNKRGWFKAIYKVTTQQGCTSADTIDFFIPGPRPKFEFQDKAGNEVTICVGDTIRFKNLTDSFTNTSSWNWFFGDGNFVSTFGGNNASQTHQYNKTGRFFVYMEQLDSVILPPNVKEICPVIFPDTTTLPGFYVNVLPRDSFDARVVKPVICLNDSNQFFVLGADTSFKSFLWEVTAPDGVVDNYTRNDTTLSLRFNKRGQWSVTVDAQYDPSRPRPWCNSGPVTLTFFVDTIRADFDIDSSGKPRFCFINKTAPDGVNYKWGYRHKTDITVTGENFNLNEETTNKNNVCVKYDSVGQYWVCLISENSNGCKDTVCKLVVNDFFEKLLISNVFTPGNGDGKNDVFRFPIAGYETFDLRIMNRWNERVFRTEDPNISWNGRVNNDGAEVPDGTYFYLLVVKFASSDEPKTISGSVNVIRQK